eukprot:CAMPEP_0185284524 /NCGR_PEP_ID=MMETSP1363-20130426/1144_1 /TAXON_ID=38817 /ORGANISM="Gephyrocapsa oceanica, Strain RCC1303" /LENGTH=196 /DNA_ID=CAMNT_0027880243 /DNA_START=103 /DNA_END=691 /DNA_ORIENTATION=+
MISEPAASEPRVIHSAEAHRYGTHTAFLARRAPVACARACGWLRMFCRWTIQYLYSSAARARPAWLWQPPSSRAASERPAAPVRTRILMQREHPAAPPADSFHHAERASDRSNASSCRVSICCSSSARSRCALRITSPRRRCSACNPSSLRSHASTRCRSASASAAARRASSSAATADAPASASAVSASAVSASAV